MSKHFIEARFDALTGLGDARIAAIVEKTCLIVDLQGRLRVLEIGRAHV
jgi:hypothetical protein